MTFKSYIYKETLELIRTYKIFIVLIVALLFALSAPLITLLLPKILASQVSGTTDFSALFQSNQTAAVQSFLGDLYQIVGMIILVFASQSIVGEFKTKKIVIPFSIGVNLSSMYLAKYLMIVVYSNIIIVVATLINYLYSAIVFQEFITSFSMTINGLFGFLIFLDFCLALVFCLSTFTQSTFVIITIALVNYYILPSILNFINWIKVGPHYLVKGLSLIPMTQYFMASLLITFSCIIVISVIGMKRIHHFKLK